MPATPFFSYRQISEAIQNTVLSLPGIEQFTYGAPWEINQTKNLNYPCVFMEISSLITIQKGQKTQNIALYFIDIPLEGRAGERTDIIDYNAQVVNTLSKMEQLSHQFLAKISSETFNNRIELYNMVPIIENYGDVVYGWRIEFNAILPFSWSSCYFDECYGEIPCVVQPGQVLVPQYYAGSPVPWVNIPEPPNPINTFGGTGIDEFRQSVGSSLCPDTIVSISTASQPDYFSAIVTQVADVFGVNRWLITFTIDYDYINANYPDIRFTVDVIFEGCCDTQVVTFEALPTGV